jgi:hypothetical protein
MALPRRGGIRVYVAAILLAACGDDGDDVPADAGSGADSGSVMLDDGMAPPDTGRPPTGADSSGGSTVGMVCANDGQCTGPGEVCCLSRLPTACTLDADCPGNTPGIDCSGRDDCPNEGNICCRVGTDQFCTRPMACEGFGGDEVP